MSFRRVKPPSCLLASVFDRILRWLLLPSAHFCTIMSENVSQVFFCMLSVSAVRESECACPSIMQARICEAAFAYQVPSMLCRSAPFWHCIVVNWKW
ncbi:hypothetical protein BCR37DRAFT_380479 [Protomyces lactucae-debilis]|uniref:Uncharacterized protein n=1 Tax=Protomyces lactucae-debilis TaxID=2754530 RepID=A0A1Y2FDT4_PROLT|nr:uncharacterized protein BCR37DRAFT_380479 [Protomyces lactucae-debilis]ORY81584.1 hypothetical protein BCR37DRAFT_380479 [Protomyces lactucae-debilis]